MKRKIFAAFLAAVMCAFCVPFLTGCSAEVKYTLQADGDGNKYYEVSCSGFVSSLKGEFVIPEYYGDGENYAPVTAIAEQGLSGTGYTKITVPKTITKIGNAAFAYSYSLTEVVFAEGFSMEEIPQGTFGCCEALRTVTIPETVKTIGYMAFYGCFELENVVLPENLQAISAKAFENCLSLAHIELPQGLTSIGSLAFYMSGLEEIVVPDSVRNIVQPVLDENGEQKLDEDGNPETYVIYGLGYGVFHTCQSLTKAVIGSGVTVLRSGVFGYCPSLKEIYLPSGLEEVEGAYFTSDGTVYYGHAFHNASSLTDVYYAGTEAQWNALLEKVNNVSASSQGATYDNSALLNASVHFGVSY